MLRKIQVKIIAAFTFVGVLIFSALGFSFIYKLNEIRDLANSSSDITNQIFEMKMLLGLYLFLFVLLMIGLGAVITKHFVSPMSSLLKSAEEATNKEKDKYLEVGKKKNEIQEIVDAFNSMNTELKEGLNEAKRQAKQMETILLHMNDGIIAFDIDGNVIHVNPAAKTFLNLEDDNITFQSVFKDYEDINLEKIIYLEDWTSFKKLINTSERTINLFFAPYKNENDRPGGVIVVIQDITEHAKLDSMRKRFVADVSHELKTPITSIMGYSDTLIENDVDEEMTFKFLTRISTEAQRMSRLVSDLLTLSRYDSAKNVIEKVEFDLGELVKYSFEGLDLELKKKNQKGDCYITSNVPTVYADKNGIERVVINILTNAIKYTPEGGTISVYVGCIYNDAYIKIIDSGIGIPKEDLDKIFERFYRVDKARTREMGGTGLGLSIAKEILDQNGGLIDIKSEVGKGTEVVIRIPTMLSKKDRDSIQEKTETSEEEIKNTEE